MTEKRDIKKIIRENAIEILPEDTEITFHWIALKEKGYASLGEKI